MKKIYAILASILIIVLFGCNKELNDLINDFEKQIESQPYTKTIEYTLTEDDYNTIASVSLVAAEDAQDSAACAAIKTYHSFAETRPAGKFIPPFLAYKFSALDSGSIAKITYNYDHSYIFSKTEILLVPDEVYDALGIDAFDEANPPEDLIPTWLDTTSAVEGLSRVLVRFDYDDGSTTSENMMYFVYEGIWYAPEDQYIFQDEDYESIDPNGNIGHYHNFSSSYPPNDYIPLFLKVKFPYSFAGDVKEVIYKYYSGVVNYHYNKFFFDGQNWNYLEIKTDQFMHKGQDGWKFDPTVKFEMSCTDYQIIVSWVQENKPEYMHPQYNNTEYYFGASSYYCNFDMRLTTRRTYDADNLLPEDDAEATQVLWQRLDEAINILLESKFPDAVPEKYGEIVYYEVTFSTYEPERHKYMIKFQCVDIGKFQPVDQDGAIEYNSHIVLVQ